MNLGDIQANIEAIGQIIVALGSLGLFGKIWQGVDLLKSIEVDVRGIKKDLDKVDIRMTSVEAFMRESKTDRESLWLRSEEHTRRLDSHDSRLAELEKK